MELIWPEDDCDFIEAFITHIKGWNVTVVDSDGDDRNVFVWGYRYDLDDDHLLCLEGRQLDEDFDFVVPFQHYWIRWDDIARLEVH